MTSVVKLDRSPAIRMEKETALTEGSRGGGGAGESSGGGGAVAVSDDDADGDKTMPRPSPTPSPTLTTTRRRTVQNALVPSTPNSRTRPDCAALDLVRVDSI